MVDSLPDVWVLIRQKVAKHLLAIIHLLFSGLVPPPESSREWVEQVRISWQQVRQRHVGMTSSSLQLNENVRIVNQSFELDYDGIRKGEIEGHSNLLCFLLYHVTLPAVRASDLLEVGSDGSNYRLCC